MMRSRIDWTRAAAVFTAFACVIGTMGCQSTPVGLENENRVAMEDTSEKEEIGESVSNRELLKENSLETEEIDSWKSEVYQEIVFEGDQISAADGVIVEGTTVTITDEGVYVLSGVLNNGRIIVNASKTDQVTLVWNGAKIFCEDASPVCVEKADKTIFYLADGTENVISDGENYLFLDEETEPDAAVFAKDDLTIKGTGSLSVYANYYDGIVCKNDLKITGGTLTVDAVHQGIKGKDSLTIQGGTILVHAGDDGIKSSNEAGVEEDGKEVGWVKIEGGDIIITAKDDAVHAESDLIINGGNITITESYEGLEGACIYINDGEISLYASDDGVNAAGYAVENTMSNEWGEKEIPDDRRDMEKKMNEDGKKDGWEELQDKPEFDGTKMPRFDEAGGNWDNRGMGTISSGGYLEINGGNLYINAQGDGIDANGSIVMNGGTVRIDGTESGGDSAIDYDGTFEINGGVLAGVGNGAMAQTATSDSKQACMAVYFDTMQKAESVITVLDDSGEEIFSYQPKKQYNFFTFSSDQLIMENTYTVLVDQIEIQSFIMSDKITVVGDAFSMGVGGFGGGFHGRDHNGIPREGMEAESGEMPLMPPDKVQ